MANPNRRQPQLSITRLSLSISD